MKNSFFYYLILLLISASCKQPNEQQKLVDTETATVDDNESEDPKRCIASDKIYAGTAWIWSQSWVSYFKATRANYTDTTSPVIFFSKEQLNALKSIDTMANGARLYYILKDETDSIPSLAMVNTFNCSEKVISNVAKSVLVSWYKGNQEFVTNSEFQNYTTYWGDYCKSIAKKNPAFTKVWAYNYAWNTLDNLSKEEDLAVKYGLKTLEPSDRDDYDIKDLNITGNVVICNILVGRSSIPLTFANLKRLGGGEGELDFAKPCPIYCD